MASSRRKTKEPTTILYDWMQKDDGTHLRGVGTEVVMKPVKCNPVTRAPASKKGSGFTKKEWTRGVIQMQWLWPGHVLQALKTLHRQRRLCGQAANDCEVLSKILQGDRDVEGPSAEWAKAIISQEEEHELRERRKRREEDKKRANAERRRRYARSKSRWQ